MYSDQSIQSDVTLPGSPKLQRSPVMATLPTLGARCVQEMTARESVHPRSLTYTICFILKKRSSCGWGPLSSFWASEFSILWGPYLWIHWYTLKDLDLDPFRKYIIYHLSIFKQNSSETDRIYGNLDTILICKTITAKRPHLAPIRQNSWALQSRYHRTWRCPQVGRWRTAKNAKDLKAGTTSWCSTLWWTFTIVYIPEITIVNGKTHCGHVQMLCESLPEGNTLV